MSEVESLKQDAKPVDLNQIQLDDDDLGPDFDPTADAYAAIPPPDDAVYVVRVELDKNKSPSGFLSGRSKQGTGYIMANVVATIEDEGNSFNGRKYFDSLSTFVSQATGACTMATFLEKALRVAVPPNAKKTELAKMLETELEGGALCRIESQWQARQEQDNGKWRTIKRGQARFPKNEDGTYNHILEDLPDKPVARGTIVDFLPMTEVD